MSERIAKLIGATFEYKVNCFCISEFFFRDTKFRQATADEMLNFVAENFHQVEKSGFNVLTLVWSRSSLELPMGEIQIQELMKRSLGFPFGLVLEHSFVQIDSESAFQKSDPSPISKVEVVSITEAIAPYIGLNGFELTMHISKSQL